MKKKIKCDECGKLFKPEIKYRRKDNVTKSAESLWFYFFKCPHCKKEYLISIKDKFSIEHEKKIDKMRDDLDDLVEDEERVTALVNLLKEVDFHKLYISELLKAYSFYF